MISISISPEARAFIAARDAPIWLELARVVHGGCGVPPLQGRPTVRFGAPPPAVAANYEVRTIDGVTVHVPRATGDRALSVEVSSFLGLHRLVVQGWNPLGWELSSDGKARP